MKPTKRKLQIKGETVRNLTSTELRRVNGGNEAAGSDNPPCITAYTCPTLISCGTCGIISIWRCTTDTLTTLTQG